MILIYYLKNNHSTLDFWRFGYYWNPLLKTWRNQFKIKKTMLFFILSRFLHVFPNNNRNIKNPMKNCYSSCIRWEWMPTFDFNSIPPCLQQRLPIITETLKIQCRMVILWVLNENRGLFLNLMNMGCKW